MKSHTVCVLILIGAASLAAETISFFRQFSTPGMDGATAVASDGSNIYVIGNRWDPQVESSSAGIRKYDPSGNELWTREVSAPGGASVTLARAAADATGVYVIAFAEPAHLLRRLCKYSAAGDELWTRELEFDAYHVAVDASGVYVAGGNYTSAYVRKYSPDGAELWTSRFGEIKTAAGVAMDATGVYTPVTNSNGAAGVIARKWDASGNELWTRELNPFDVHRTFAAAYPTGFYVVATDARGTGTFLRKYDSGGNELWSRNIDPFDFGSIAADSTGVYVVGTTPVWYGSAYLTVLPGQCRSGSGGDSFVRKYDPDGTEAWTRQFGTAQATWASGVVVDAIGVYVAGGVRPDGFRDWWELAPPEILETVEPASAFLAKFEKSPAVVTGAGPRIFRDCVVNAASYLGGGVAPGEMVTLFGSAIGPLEPAPLSLTEDGSPATTLAETRILFNGLPAPLAYVSDTQSTAIVPHAVAGRTSVDVQVEHKGARSEVVTVPVLRSRPGIFSVDGSGQGQGVILNEDGSINSPSNPALRGSIITIYATGEGEADLGEISVFFDLGNNEYLVQAKRAEVLSAGGVSGAVAGVLQVKVRVPANAEDTGDAVPFALFIGSHWTVFQVTMALR